MIDKLELDKLEKIDFLLSKLNSEGFDYCFEFYSNWKEIDDKEFHKLRKKYLKSKNKLNKHIIKLRKKIENLSLEGLM